MALVPVLAMASAAWAALPGDAQLRSSSGAPLNLRIALPRDTGTPLEDTCFRLAPLPPATAPLPLTLTLVEARAERYLRIESASAMPAGVLRFTVVSGCAAGAVESRDYAIEISPRQAMVASPAISATSAISIAGATSGVDDLRYALPGAAFTAREGDTLALLAQRFYPGEKARQAQFAAALRAHNEALRGLAPDQGIPGGTPMVLPNLFSLSGIAPEQTAHGPRAVANAASNADRPRAVERARGPRVPAAATTAATTTAPPAVPARNAPVVVATAEPATALRAPAATPAKELPPSRHAGPVAAAPPGTPPRAGEFRLRLSSSEIDLAPSRRVTEEQRRALRQRHAILDADDQMAALLALQNTLRQVEARLSDVERNAARQAAELAAKSGGITLQASKAALAPPAAAPSEARSAQATTPSTAVAAPLPAPATAATPVKPAPAEVSKAEAGSMPTPAASAPTADTVKPAAKPADEQARPPAPPRATQPVAPSGPPTGSPREAASMLPDGAMLGGGIALLAALAGLWVWARRRNVSADSPRPAAAAPTAKPNAAAAESAPQDDADWQVEMPAEPAFESTARMAAAPTTPPAPPPPAAAADDDDTPARFELDSTPVSHLDLSLDDRPDEDRVRRLQYMYERFPELMSRTVSIDDADSVINSSRLYYEEGQSDRACELLTFGVEERPQEVRFWLAQFEIFRLENRAADFSTLAAKFHVLFSYSPAWPKVRHIGHELDPANPLFAAGREVLGDDARFDPVVENWLNAPMDFTADALMSDLRRELFDEHNVDKSDFDSLSARLSPAAAMA